MEQITIDDKEFAKTLVVAGEDQNETCGLMIGNGNVVKEIVMMENETPSPVYFTVAAMEAGKIIIDAKAKGMKVIGVFHSHPNNHPQPSMTDHDYMGESWPYIWTIYSPCYKTWASWRRVGDEIIPVETIINYG
jgi:proteasome lid subunit RPN8/RPN11